VVRPERANLTSLMLQRQVSGPQPPAALKGRDPAFALDGMLEFTDAQPTNRIVVHHAWDGSVPEFGSLGGHR
jgi:hypothetical protein